MRAIVRDGQWGTGNRSWASHSHVDHGGGDASDMTAWAAVCLSGCRSVRVGGLRRSAPVCACTGMRGQSRRRCSHRGSEPAFLSAHPHAAQRAVPGWRGGLGRVGADLASAGSMRPPPSPARTDSTARLATTHVRRDTAARQAKTGSPPNLPAKKQQRHPPQSRNSSPPPKPSP